MEINMSKNPKVGIIMGSDSDLPILQEAADILKKFNVDFEMTVISAHRTPERAVEYSKTAVERGLSVIIAGAGGAAHLAGVIAALTPLPVIGLPVLSKSLSGMDSLFSMVQMPKGIPVATVAINGGANAGLLAVQILGTADKALRQAMIDYKENMKKEVAEKAKKVEAQAAL
jgi:5-(carboxyamino)imidazole ribonucleotide mutase